MKQNFYCTYNMDTDCVELISPEGYIVAVNCTVLED